MHGLEGHFMQLQCSGRTKLVHAANTKSKANLAHIQKETLLVVTPLPQHPVCIRLQRSYKVCMQYSTIMRFAFQEGTVAVWVVQDAQWTCQGG